MKNLMLATFVVSILIGALGCQNPPNRIRSGGNLNSSGAKYAAKAASPAAKTDISQLQPSDVIVVNLIYLGYNQSPSTVSKVTLATSISAIGSTSTDGKIPGQKELFENYSENTQDFPQGTKGALFTMRFPWQDIQGDLAQVNSDSKKPFYLNWEFSTGGKTGNLFSTDLSSRIKNALANSSADAQKSIDYAKYNVADLTKRQKTGAAKALQSLAFDSHLAEIYPMVGIEIGDIDSFSYVGMTVAVEPAPTPGPTPSPAPTAVPKK